jgi:hypothetical protein
MNNYQTLIKVPLVPQEKSNLCWFACSMMLYRWSVNKSGQSSMIKDPHENDIIMDWHKKNQGVDADQVTQLAMKLNFRSHKFADLPRNFAEMKAVLQKHGPIWTAVSKNWNGQTGQNIPHVIVIYGVLDTGVWIHDPEPVKKGTTRLLTWSDLKNADTKHEYLGVTADPN